MITFRVILYSKGVLQTFWLWSPNFRHPSICSGPMNVQSQTAVATTRRETATTCHCAKLRCTFPLHLNRLGSRKHLRSKYASRGWGGCRSMWKWRDSLPVVTFRVARKQLTFDRTLFFTSILTHSPATSPVRLNLHTFCWRILFPPSDHGGWWSSSYGGSTKANEKAISKSPSGGRSHEWWQFGPLDSCYGWIPNGCLEMPTASGVILIDNAMMYLKCHLEMLV